MPCVDTSHSHLPCPALPPQQYIQFFFIFYAQLTSLKRLRIPSTCQSHLTPGHTAGIWQIQLCFYYPRQTYHLFFFPSVLIILMFSQHLLDDFWKCFEATSSLSSRFKFMHIAYVNSSAQGRMKEGRKDVDMLIWIYAHMCICICILDWLLLPFRRIICIFAFQFADIFSFLFFCSSSSAAQKI